MIRGGSQQSELDEHELGPNKDKNHHFSRVNETLVIMCIKCQHRAQQEH